ncbi:hypothetical protein LTR36_004526 [Oleoguttula mirabilis]|uniref:O-methyltransferase C-terminal domain-containing protein n=1 Tax=Oleoguttula mirabilis TaxID=1507867 RepID=A0AAV9JFE8_9PEZI|nr:hypothetical protein LTR36_004526 [Oleoguttula mirabilis]
MNAKDTIAGLSDIDRASFGENESGRMQALLEVRALVERLEKPWETVVRMVWTQPTLLLTVKTASEMGLFAALSSTPQDGKQIGHSTGADPILASRLLRMLAAGAIVQEVGVDTYIACDFSRALRDRQGIMSGIHHFWDVGVQQVEKLPAYLRRTGYKNPSDAAHPPFESIVGTSSYWEYFNEHPEARANFHNFLSFRYAWVRRRPLCVDVGGGKGRDLKHLADAIQDDKARLVLQDLHPVIEEAKKEQLPPQIELLAHNFFGAQPCRGARAYFLHSILHDWPASEAHKILTLLKEAGKPGYTKILLLEAVMPDRIKDIEP